MDRKKINGHKPGGTASGKRKATKKTFPPKHKPVNQRYHTIIAITRILNGRQQFISKMSTSSVNGIRFIPHYTSDRNNAKDFLTHSLASDHLDLLHVGAGSDHHIEPITVPFKSLQEMDADGPHYEIPLPINSTDVTE